LDATIAELGRFDHDSGRFRLNLGYFDHHCRPSGKRQLYSPRLPSSAHHATLTRFFRRTLSTLKVTPSEVVTDAAPVYPRMLDELIPQAWHHVERYVNNPIEADHSQLKHRLGPMRDCNRQDNVGDHRRTRLRSEPPTRPLRTGRRRPAGNAGVDGLR
jgi:hypothetical protein